MEGASNMRRADRLSLMVVFFPLALSLGGCETSSFWDGVNNMSDKFNDTMADFNPFGGGKKKLPGERREVFPGGVPGVQQGVPPDLMRHQPAEQALAQPQAAPEPAATPEAPAKPKKTEKKKAQARAPAEPKSSDPPEDGVWPPPPARTQ